VTSSDNRTTPTDTPDTETNPMQNIPKFFGDDTDIKSPLIHVYEFEAYLTAYDREITDLPEVEANEEQAQFRRDRIENAVKKFGLSFRRTALEWFQDYGPRFLNKLDPVIEDWTRFKNAFLLRFNPYGRTKQELMMEWEGLRRDENISIDTLWAKIKTIGTGIPATPSMLTEKLKMCVPAAVYQSIMRMDDPQEILDTVRKIAVNQKQSGVKGEDTNVQAKKVSDTESLMVCNDSLEYKENERLTVDKKLEKKMASIERGMQDLMKCQMELLRKTEVPFKRKGRSWSRDRDRSSSRDSNKIFDRGRDKNRRNRDRSKDRDRSRDRTRSDSRERTKLRQPNMRKARSPRRPIETSGRYECRYCGKSGHLWRQCFTLKNQIVKMKHLHADKRANSMYKQSDTLNEEQKMLNDLKDLLESYGCRPTEKEN
jgi:hypothetical protein